MIKRIVSGGQTGVDRGALDAALAAGVDCGGWCPRGRRAEDGLIPALYPMTEAPGARYIARTKLNVRDSDGTIVLAPGAPSGGTRATIEHASRLGRPCLVLDLASIDDMEAVSAATRWVETEEISVLNVAGPRASGWADGRTRADAVISGLLRQFHPE